MLPYQYIIGLLKKKERVKMFQYFLYGLHIQSDLEFLQLNSDDQIDTNLWDVEISKIDVPKDLFQRTDKKYEFKMNRSWLSNRTAWIVVENGKKIGYCLKQDGNVEYLKTYILGYGMAMLAMQQKKIALHCSVVENGQGAILIAGESGAGKSTLTAGFLEEKYKIMADDMALILPQRGKESIVYAGFPYQKLCREEAIQRGYDVKELYYINEEKDKYLVPCITSYSEEPQKIRALIILGKTAQTEAYIAQIKGIAKLQAIANNLFLRNLLRDEKYSPIHGQLCLDVAAQIPIYFIGRPKEKDTRDEIKKLAFQCLKDTL